MTNKEIVKQFKLASSLLELHGANPFKIRAFGSIVFVLERMEEALEEKTLEELIALDIKKGMAEKIIEINHLGSFAELNELVENTPAGVIEMLDIKGIGAKKIKTIWKELGIETIQELLEACKAHQISQLKGFGAKTEDLIIEQIEYIRSNAHKLRYADAEPFGIKLKELIENSGVKSKVEISGQLRRSLEVVNKIQLVVGSANIDEIKKILSGEKWMTYEELISGPFSWKGTVNENGVSVEIKFASEENFTSQLFLNSASAAHLAYLNHQGKSLRSQAELNTWESEEKLYEANELQFIPSEMREGFFELEQAKNKTLPKLVELGDLKGILHNHSTYSDGKHSLEEMAKYCKELGYEYLGISDHSVSAFYANGLDEDRIVKQHAEINELNQKLAPFKIFKGIESDILNDGSLDYPEEVLKTFDFIVASIHSNLNMNMEKATERLIKAIENPYTTILGHPTGRLLLKREGYPIDHKAVIDACAKHNVAIEINANPWRLDLDWRWVKYAIDQNIMISINPDAHEKDGYHDMKYGLLVGRKAGLTKEMTLNALNLGEFENYLEKKLKKL
ncbi:DNA polymerase/3'-5' exonuclease PolX [Flexithrix dorotheae]|uniref:DNA polymerase/3'-5' exonuclease PolX n=1 Tax=Flexithrix dorotheae TaxID=70993 RepID=UPI000380AA5C|nr:DNA polymerase/3'-5' exonuclease PolX [Flexithrix dorotheae]